MLGCRESLVLNIIFNTNIATEDKKKLELTNEKTKFFVIIKWGNEARKCIIDFFVETIRTSVATSAALTLQTARPKVSNQN